MLETMLLIAAVASLGSFFTAIIAIKPWDHKTQEMFHYFSAAKEQGQ